MTQPGKLTLIPTPIGNLGDITLRSLDALKTADAIYAEDTRVTGKLLHALDLTTAPLQRLDENTISDRAADVITRIASGETVAYCTDAGMPGVSDPGLRLVRAVREAGLPVEVLPGPSAAATAYVTSGTTCPRYYFGGFFPRKPREQAALLESLRPLDAALVFYESPRRLVAALAAIAEAFPHREVAVCRELTKLHEEVARASAPEIAQEFAARESGEGDPIKGEIVIVIDPPSPEESASAGASAAEDARATAVQLAAEGESQKSISKRLVQMYGIARNDAYAIALEAKSAAQ